MALSRCQQLFDRFEDSHIAYSAILEELDDIVIAAYASTLSDLYREVAGELAEMVLLHTSQIGPLRARTYSHRSMLQRLRNAALEGRGGLLDEMRRDCRVVMAELERAKDDMRTGTALVHFIHTARSRLDAVLHDLHREARGERVRPTA